MVFLLPPTISLDARRAGKKLKGSYMYSYYEHYDISISTSLFTKTVKPISIQNYSS